MWYAVYCLRAVLRPLLWILTNFILTWWEILINYQYISAPSVGWMLKNQCSCFQWLVTLQYSKKKSIYKNSRLYCFEQTSILSVLWEESVLWCWFYSLLWNSSLDKENCLLSFYNCHSDFKLPLNGFGAHSSWMFKMYGEILLNNSFLLSENCNC